ncbi:MAG: ABC transporter ATP-binding protein [Chloroflexi bacterium]|nr:ABC transporter ATP-binding protein [Chloroflexota bacterium]
MATESILIIKNVTMQFGGVRAVHNVDIDLKSGEMLGLIGPNGAGKTTIFNLITGSIQPTEGDILFKGKTIRGKRVDEICHLGISRTFQNIRLFQKMSVFENVALGLHSKPHYSLAEAFIRTPHAAKAENELKEKAYELLKMVNLQDEANKPAGILPYGLQRRLEIARAMATNPDLLLLDEPAAGMNEDECNELVKMVRNIHEQMHYSIILIEHHMNVVMDLCRDANIVVLNLGEVLAVGTPEKIQNDPKVIQAYLGSKRGQNDRYATPA